MTRYVLHPGWVTSKNDSDQHYIGARRLADLYGVPMSQCRVYDPEKDDGLADGEVNLYPRYDGNYTIPQ